MSVRFAPAAAATIVVTRAIRPSVTLTPSQAPTSAPPMAAAKPVPFVEADQFVFAQAA